MNQKVRSIDFLVIDEAFDMGSGWVLDFSDRTFAHFFADELNVDIDDPRYSQEGTSKAKRLRYYLRTVDTPSAVRALKVLWEYRTRLREARPTPDKSPNLEGRFLELVRRLEGTAPATNATAPIHAFIRRPQVLQLKADLVTLATLAPHPRGYAFEKFLNSLFGVYDLAARDPFRLRGEQIDGSFQHANDTYLLEAKYLAGPVGADVLHVFQGKIDQKAAWTRGLVISNSGFTEDGLHAFGRAKRLICMDGLDLFEMLDRELPLPDVLDRKLRAAAETGSVFVRVRDLFSK
jgi:hypothetical protein